MVNTSIRSPDHLRETVPRHSATRATECTRAPDVGELMDMTINGAKRAARALREQLSATGLTHSRALEIVAQQLGYPDWNTASARLQARTGLGSPVPVLRSLDEARAREFYVGFLWLHDRVGAPIRAELASVHAAATRPTGYRSVRASWRWHTWLDDLGAGRRCGDTAEGASGQALQLLKCVRVSTPMHPAGRLWRFTTLSPTQSDSVSPNPIRTTNCKGVKTIR